MMVSVAARRLAEFRRRNDVTLREIAEKLGVSITTVFQYERGVIRPSDKRRRALKRATGGYVRLSDWERFDEHAEAQ